MQSVLIVSSNEKTAELVMPLINDMYPGSTVTVCAGAKDARRMDMEFDLVIINSPLRDEPGAELAMEIVKNSVAGCLMITKADNADEMSDKLSELGVMVLERPISKKMFVRSVRLINAARKRFMGTLKENEKLHRELGEIKMINRAKLVLMKYLKFSEQQAHRYIEKQSMDLRMSKYDIALKVVKTYDLDA